jgi:hypothetical protein
MTAATVPGLESIYLEDSYFLGVVAFENGLRLRALFALTADHPAYTSPTPGEQHCYRNGEIRVEGLRLNDWKPGRPSLLTDPGGAVDFGRIDVSREGVGYRVDTEWFDMKFEADTVTAVLD